MIFYGSDAGDLHERIKQMFDQAKAVTKKPAYMEPQIYGFTMGFSRDGKPLIEEFGNVSPYGTAGYMEPATDVIEKVDSVLVIVELPSVEKSDIDLRASVESVMITVDKPLRKYVKDVKLSCRVKPESAVARYNNGVLEVTLKRADDANAGRRVQVQ